MAPGQWHVSNIGCATGLRRTRAHSTSATSRLTSCLGRPQRATKAAATLTGAPPTAAAVRPVTVLAPHQTRRQGCQSRPVGLRLQLLLLPPRPLHRRLRPGPPRQWQQRQQQHRHKQQPRLQLLRLLRELRLPPGWRGQSRGECGHQQLWQARGHSHPNPRQEPKHCPRGGPQSQPSHPISDAPFWRT